MKKIIDIKNITQIEKIALALTITILLAIAIRLLYSFNKDSDNLNYKEVNAEYLISLSNESFDREIYSTLEQIVSSFVVSYNLEIDPYKGYVDYSKIKYKREDYYKIISPDYKKKLNKTNYLELSKVILNKFVVKGINGIYVRDIDLIDKVYKLDEKKYKDMFICRLNTKDDSSSYIGIQLNTDYKTYNIFYLE